MKRPLWEYFYLFAVAGIIFCLDQITKIMVRTYLQPSETWTPVSSLAPYFQVVHSSNTGMVLGFLRSTNGLFIALSEVACIAVVFLYPSLCRRGNSLLLGLGLGLLLGGAAGNMVDRMIAGYVTDVFLLSALPVFNLADMSIFIGAIITGAGLLTSESRHKQIKSIA